MGDSDERVNEFRRDARKMGEKLGSFSDGEIGAGGSFRIGGDTNSATFNPYSSYNSKTAPGGAKGGYMDNSSDAPAEYAAEWLSKEKKRREERKKERKLKKKKKNP